MLVFQDAHTFLQLHLFRTFWNFSSFPCWLATTVLENALVEIPLHTTPIR